VYGESFVGGLAGNIRHNLGSWEESKYQTILTNNNVDVAIFITAKQGSGANSIGGLAGGAGQIEIENNHVEGSIQPLSDEHSAWYVGGLIGRLIADGSFINNSSTNVSINGSSRDFTDVGGLIGHVASHSYVTTEPSGWVNNSSAVGDINAGGSVAGLIAHIYHEFTVTNSFATGNAHSDTSTAGGLVAHIGSGGVIENCFATGNVSGQKASGGLIAGSHANIINSYAHGDVNGLENVGGLVGHVSAGEIINAYAQGDVKGSDYVGGLIGNVSSGKIEYVYASGQVDGEKSNIGGLIGFSDDLKIKDSFWDVITTGQHYSAGGFGVITDLLQLQDFLEAYNWNFTDTWFLEPGHYAKFQHFHYKE
ncbi:MAG: GLUG motif-containing protein, partial [Gammaproteobacteria bacterium]